MKVTHYIVPPACFPRYNYSQKHVLPLVERYRHILERLCLEDIYPTSNFGDVSIYVIHDETSIQIKEENIATKNTDKISSCQLPFPLHDDITKSQSINIFVATHAQTLEDDKILANKGSYILLLDNEDKVSPSPLSRGKNEMIYTTTATNFPKIVIDLLERIVFWSLFERVKVLQCFIELGKPQVLFRTLESDTKADFKKQTDKKLSRQESSIDINTSVRMWWTSRFEALKRIVRSQYNKTSEEFTDRLIDKLLCSDESETKYPESQICEAVLPVLSCDLELHTDQSKPEGIRSVVNEIKTSYRFTLKCDKLSKAFTKHAELVGAHKNLIEELHGEIQGMYYRSKIPAGDKPTNTTELCGTLDQKVADQILNINGVTGVGYRYSVLDIFLKDTLTGSVQEEAENAVCDLLKRENITKYLFHKESENVINFAAEVGSTVQVNGTGGTLGGFAKLGKQKDLCVLLSRHVADQGESLYLQAITMNMDMSPFAHLLKPKIALEKHGSLDIAIAKVAKKYRRTCHVKFKDEEGIRRASDLYKYDDIKRLSGLPVYIWGAKSSPGLGKIVIPVLFMKDMEETLMKIEDRVPTGREFAQEGDSGSVVCAHDPDEESVCVLAMLIGKSNNSLPNKQDRPRYVSFRLINGLKQLEKEQDEEIELC